MASMKLLGSYPTNGKWVPFFFTGFKISFEHLISVVVLFYARHLPCSAPQVVSDEALGHCLAQAGCSFYFAVSFTVWTDVRLLL